MFHNAQLKETNNAVDAPPLRVSRRGYVVDYNFWELLVGDCPPERFEEMWDLVAVLYEDADDFVKKHVFYVG